MAAAFNKPKFDYDYDLEVEKKNVDLFFTDVNRAIPEKLNKEIDLATWNIANLGVQKRRDKDLALIAYILSKFDIIAVQEVRAQLGHFNKILENLKNLDFRAFFTDVAGASERLAVIYRNTIVKPGPLIGELDYNPNGIIENGRYVVLPKKQKFNLGGRNIETYFENFNRNPFLTTWEVIGSDVSFMLANVHIYYGGQETVNLARFNNRIAEVYFLADWAKELQRKENVEKVYEPNVILIGDMNIPTMDSNDKVYRAIKRRGFVRTRYSSEAGTTIQEFTKYDQIIFSNENISIKEINKQTAVVMDYDNFVFKDLWAQVENGTITLTQFKAWTKFVISDHRPIFVRIQV